MLEYMVIRKTNLEELVATVNWMLKEGWKPSGGIFIIKKNSDSLPSLDENIYHQPITREMRRGTKST
ncbi:MAG: DUF1737 domain-containing protein [Colwellia sp.]|nr:DUF1737 domain-containing protein [Colwellia sp.]